MGNKKGIKIKKRHNGWLWVGLAAFVVCAIVGVLVALRAAGLLAGSSSSGAEGLSSRCIIAGENRCMGYQFIVGKMSGSRMTYDDNLREVLMGEGESVQQKWVFREDNAEGLSLENAQTGFYLYFEDDAGVASARPDARTRFFVEPPIEGYVRFRLSGNTPRWLYEDEGGHLRLTTAPRDPAAWYFSLGPILKGT